MKQPPRYGMSSPGGRNRVSSNLYAGILLHLKQFTLFLFFSLFFDSAALGQLADEVSKTWIYSKIYDKEGKPGRRIGAHDLLCLRKEEERNSFSYALQIEDIKAWGYWTLEDSTLVFDYEAVASGPTRNSSDKPEIRRFRILKITKEEMLIREVTQPDKPGLYFEFRYFAD